jgi:dTDP-4-amino-4,6-dideoxygalactose transaminase
MGKAELDLVREAFASNWIAPLGPHVDAFEKEFAALVGSTHAAALSSGTAALHLALKLVGVKAGDEVFCSTFTFSASANPIVYEAAKPVFIDSEAQSWNMDPALLEQALAERAKQNRLPKAVVLVHLYGQAADIDAIATLCARYGVTLIEDAAEALGASYAPGVAGGLGLGIGGGRKVVGDSGLGVGGADSLSATRRNSGSGAQAQTTKNQAPSAPAAQPPTTQNQPPSFDPAGGAKVRTIMPGTVGRMGIYSFNGNKIITTSGGGMLVSAEKELIEKARFLATQARDPAPHYQHSEIGYNYRLSNVLAAIGRGQLRVLADRVAARRRNTEFYRQAFADLPGIDFMPEAPWGKSTRWLTCITIDPKKFGADREKVRLALADENIEARPLWKPMHLQPVFAHCDKFVNGVSESLFEHGLCLPSGSNLSEGELARVVDVVRKARQ